MKKLKILFVAVQAVVAVLMYCFMPAALATILFLIFLFVCSLFFAHYLYTQKLHAEWLKQPVLPEDLQFDDFFWRLTISNQDWYVDNILKKEGLEKLIVRYNEELTAIWQKKDLDLREKLAETSVYCGRLQTLTSIREFNYELQRH